MRGRNRGKLYDTDLSGAAWGVIEPLPPPARPGGRQRTTCPRSVLDAIVYVLRTGCQWRLPRREYPPRSTARHFRTWKDTGAWVLPHRSLCPRTPLAARG